MILRGRRSLSSLCNQSLLLDIRKFFSTSEPGGHPPPPPPPPPVSVSDYLTDRHRISRETALRVSSHRGHLKDTQKVDSVIQLLKDTGFTAAHFESAFYRAPCLPFYSVENIRPKLQLLQEAGLSQSDIVDITSNDPWILTRSADNRLLPSFTALKGVLGSVADASKALKLCGWLLRSDLTKTLVPNVELLKSAGLDPRQVNRYLLAFPRLFLMKPEKIKEFIDQVDEMGVERSSLVFLPAIRALGSMSPENWKLKLDVFRSLGFSDGDILSIFRKVPLTFTVSEKKIREAYGILCDIGGVNTAYLVKRPELLMLSVERRLKPRLRVMKILKSQNLLKKKIPNLCTTCKATEKVFLKNYVIPYIEFVGDAYGEVGSLVTA